MKQKIERCIRHILASFIHPGKKKTIKNVLKYALKLYLTKYYGGGLCIYVVIALDKYDYKTNTLTRISSIIPQFKRKIAIEHFNGSYNPYWWKPSDWFSRYKFMKWLIKQY